MPGLAPYARILAANERQSINVRGTTVFLRLASGTVAVTVRSNQVGTKSGASYTLRMDQAEKWFHAEEFDEIVLEDVSGAQNTVEFYIGYGDFEKPVPDIVNVQVTSAESEVVTTEVDETNIDVGNAGQVQLLPADADRVFAIITALSGNAEEIRIGDTNIDTDRGTPLDPGDTIKWTSKAACFACSIATVDQGAAKTIFSVT
jgi:hypothetical protein